MAASYHQLGMVAQNRGRLEEAEDWYRKSLAIDEDLGNRPGMAGSYHQLGMIAQDRGRLEEAEDWYRKSLAIREDLGDRPGTADSYHQLGIVAQHQERLEEAEHWYRTSLAIRRPRNRPGMAASYHQLGNAAHPAWAAGGGRALVPQVPGHQRGPRESARHGEHLWQLGLLAEQRGQPRQALEWMVRCVTLFEQFPHPLTGPGPEHLARLTAQLGIGALEASWREVTGSPLPQAVRDYISSSRPGTGEQQRG